MRVPASGPVTGLGETSDHWIGVYLWMAVIATIITVSIIASLRATRGQGRQALPAPTEPPFRVATEAEDAALQPLWRPAQSTHHSHR